MARCARVAPLLLAHLNLLLVMFAGGALVTAARLKWDPSTYLLVRELFPVEYRVTAGVLTGAGVSLVLLAHLALAAVVVRPPRTRRALLLLYAALMTALAAAELAWSGWMAHRAHAWLQTSQAEHILEGLELREHVKPILDFFGQFHPLPNKVNNHIKEVEQDVPRNVYAAAAGAALLAAAHALAVLLALALALAAGRPRARRLSHSSWVTTSTSVTGDSSEKAPLRTAYRNGRIVVL